MSQATALLSMSIVCTLSLPLLGCAGDAGDAPSSAGSPSMSPGREDLVLIPVKGDDGSVRMVPMKNDRGRAVVGDMDFGAIDDIRTRSISPNDPALRWPEAKVRYYVEIADPETRLTPAQHINFIFAMEYIEEHTPIRFQQWGSLEGDIVYVWNDVDDPDASHSAVGRQGGTQDLRIGVNAAGVGTIVHELTHALGMKHEHQRPDRISFISYCEENVTPGRTGYFEPLDWGDYEGFGRYDFHSIMHYGAGTFVTMTDPSQCGGFALDPIDDTYPDAPGNQTFGSEGIYSAEDLNALQLLYGRRLASAEAGDAFATSLAIADFDRDGYADVIAGAPGKKLGTPLVQNGASFAFKGTGRGLAAWKVLSFLTLDDQQAELGHALATGDFDGDGYPDLAVGAPGQHHFDLVPGKVHIFRGGQYAIGNQSPACGGVGATPCAPDREPLERATTVDLLPSDSPGVLDENGGRFGSALAARDFDGDGRTDLVVGAPGLVAGNGRVFVYSGEVLAKAMIEHQPPSSVVLSNQLKKGPAAFGTALAIGDFNDDNVPDLAVGAPDESNGRVHVFRALSTQSFTLVNIIDAPTGLSAGDGFGSVLLAPDLGGPKLPTFLAVGSPRASSPNEDRPSAPPTPDAGRVDLFGSREGAFNFAHRQTIDPGQFAGRFGSALATMDLDADKIADLVVGAPTAGDEERGAVVMLRSDVPHVSFWDQVWAPSDTLLFGASLATGRIRGPSPPSFGGDVLPTRLLVGAPGHPLGTLVNVGRFYGYAFVPGPAQREMVTEAWTSQFVVD